ncbi:dTMP kinase [Candidatus Saganbacteria bacterium]|uniref:Thymidylate kinase n=1 Tax=Candidatus Saganbacteria bacterium TaxID=2575572 RepID=A0A9D6YXE4_UNCSA|nr:dTMP kinase [Candidatus Saganbacteria bacterium]
MFITFEGGEGCGKSSHSRKLKTYLEGKGFRVMLTREPGGTRLGREIRNLLLHPESAAGGLDEITELLFFAADRVEHVGKVILPAIDDKKIVISDRFSDSTAAYQIGGRNLPEDLVRYLNMVSGKGLLPDLTLLLDVSPEVGLKRAALNAAADRFEKEMIEFHRRVREKYLEIAREEPQRIKVINTDDKNLEEIQEIVRRIVDEKLGN